MHIALQRIRNRIIEHLELTASPEKQRKWDTNEVVNGWEDWVSEGWQGSFIPPIFSQAEIEGIEKFSLVWLEVVNSTPNPLPQFEQLREHPSWLKLMATAKEVLAVFQVMGKLSEEESTKHVDPADPVPGRLNSNVKRQIMRIGTETEHTDLVVLERVPVGVPNEGDLRVQVSVTLGAFCGTYDYVWLEQAALAEFVERLTSLERSRSGEALLQSLSPDEFSFKLRSRDNSGHFVAEVSLQRYQYSGPIYWPTNVSGGFELEPTELPKIVSQFRALVDA
ncbi:WapI family immunity protein [Stenotrophomonas humi]|nr:hypothetical protein [Stenotrophomonas humi]